MFKVFRLVGMPTGITSNSLLLRASEIENDKNVCENFTFGGLCPINSHHIIDHIDMVF